MPSVKVCFAPPLFPYYKNDNAIIVIVDILRATSSICTAFMNGVESIIPVGNDNDLLQYKHLGYVIAGELNGIKLDIADIGNSPHFFSKERVEDKIIAYSTTNGTKIINMAADCKQVVIGSFLNISALAAYLINEKTDVVIFCGGWKNKFNTEDALFAGALAQKLLLNNEWNSDCDAAYVSIGMWNNAQINFEDYIQHLAWLKRLKMKEVVDYCFKMDLTKIIPVLKNEKIIQLVK
jgi:2-phosphosulfolactate phosphatase